LNTQTFMHRTGKDSTFHTSKISWPNTVCHCRSMESIP